MGPCIEGGRGSSAKAESNDSVETTLGVVRFSERKVHRAAAVSFCDIPVQDLSIHMKKYSRFGLAFHKFFLLTKEGNAGFLYGERLDIAYQPQVDWAARDLSAGQYSRAFFLNSFISKFCAKRLELFCLLVRQYQESTPAEEKLNPCITNLLTDIEVLMRGVDREFLSYCVPFGASSIADDEKTFYMEREWRALSDIRFRHRRRSTGAAFPDYAGQLDFPA